MLQDAAPATAAELGKADDGQWAQLKTSDLRKLVKQVQQEQERTLAAKKAAPPEPSWENPSPTPVKVSVRIQTAAERLAKQGSPEEPAKPDTVNIRKPGEYEIDLKGLLERNPIVVHKDGAYLIHLPSLFDQGKK
jgi:predicted  nucleic acid-binding Zn-ribbon protein